MCGESKVFQELNIFKVALSRLENIQIFKTEINEIMNSRIYPWTQYMWSKLLRVIGEKNIDHYCIRFNVLQHNSSESAMIFMSVFLYLSRYYGITTKWSLYDCPCQTLILMLYLVTHLIFKLICDHDFGTNFKIDGKCHLSTKDVHMALKCNK